jgi:hypothetical protein
MMSYLRPFAPTGLASWQSHRNRNPPSQEPGVDYYTPIGTPMIAAGDGRVVSAAGDIWAATGRFMTIDLDDGRRVRYLHMRSFTKSAGDRVRQGAVIGYSGASGYGSEYFGADGMHDFPWGETGGPQTHVTLWPSHAYSFGPDANTLDFEQYVDGGAWAGDGGSDFLGDDMFSDADRATLTAVQLALGAGGLAPGGIKDEDTVLQRLGELETLVRDLLDGTGTNGATAAGLAEDDTVLGIVRGLRDDADGEAP